jgi:hypothetical protein
MQKVLISMALGILCGCCEDLADCPKANSQDLWDFMKILSGGWSVSPSAHP